MAPLVSVVVPTYNEGANIGPLLQALEAAFAGVEAEFVVVDDDSRDGTAQKAQAASPRARVVVRRGERGLATAVVRGMGESRGDFVAVMDADFQHPPAAVRALLDRAVATGADLVVGSRYAEGGSEGGFGLARRTVSRGAARLARLALPPVRRHRVSDPMSGLFLLRRDRVDAAALRPKGYKILLELLARCDFGRVEEVGYRFGARTGGKSKLGATVLLQYLLHLGALGLWHPDNQRAVRFMAVGLSGVAVNLLTLFALHGLAGMDRLLAAGFAVEASILSNFLLNDRLTFFDRRDAPWPARLGMFHLVSLAGAAVNLGAFFVLAYLLQVQYLLAAALAIVAAFGVNYLGNLRFTYAERRPAPRAWVPILVLVAASAGLYTANLGGIHDVYFDEHYYVTVAHQLERGILEDPCWAHDAKLPGRPLNFEHPPLAKLMVWASVHAYDTYRDGFEGCRAPDDREGGGKERYDNFTAALRTQGNPWAWRTPSAVMGVVAVAFAALAARRIFRSDLAGALAGSFVLLDNLMLSSSRIALLDIFAVGFTMVAVWFATFPTRRGVLLAALFLGLGFSCKYYVVLAGPPTLLLSLWAHRRAGVLRRRRFDLHVVAYPLVPILAWVASYTPWWLLWFRTKGFLGAVAHWAKVQAASIAWLTVGTQTHQYASPPLQWPAVATPMSYIGPASPGPGTVAGYVYAIGNPALWAMAFLAAAAIPLWLVAGWLASLARVRQGPFAFLSAQRRSAQALVMAALFPLLAYGGFVALNPSPGDGAGHRTTFIFYMTLVVPFLAVLLGGLLATAWRSGRWAARAGVVAACILAAAAFLWYLPVTLYVPIPRQGFAWLPIDGTPLHYPAPGFHDIMRLLPWMREYGSWDCWSGQAIPAGGCP